MKYDEMEKVVSMLYRPGKNNNNGRKTLRISYQISGLNICYYHYVYCCVHGIYFGLSGIY